MVTLEEFLEESNRSSPTHVSGQAWEDATGLLSPDSRLELGMGRCGKALVRASLAVAGYLDPWSSKSPSVPTEQGLQCELA